MSNQIEFYQGNDGQTQIEVKFIDDTIWLTQLQMATLFDKDVRTVNEHIKNIYKTGELEMVPTIRKFRIVRQEGARQVERDIDHYNLDIIISVGYRVNSKRGTQFRQWATARLKEYLIQGYAINERRLAEKQQQVQVLKDGIRIINRALEQSVTSIDMDWLKLFSRGLTLLDDYDHETLDAKGVTTQEVHYPDYEEYMEFIQSMYSDFESGVFAKEKDNGFHSSINQIKQSFGDQDLYPSLEEKAAMLLYFIVKNHSFVDGNKRIAAACFIYFLKENNHLMKPDGQPVISNEALASLTLFVAVSNPAEIYTVKNLIISVLNRSKKE
ncbi:MAG: virulence protein RhuM/Fic/DOC family protein [Desulfamplus sp.]|nr:virulence protein RhuM/Fic/DOC family protein [Desulfamplus sp.]